MTAIKILTGNLPENWWADLREKFKDKCFYSRHLEALYIYDDHLVYWEDIRQQSIKTIIKFKNE